MSTTAPASETAVPSPRKFRADVQGLRMVAVLAVILDHLVGWPLGGFVGVDIFFVISGFLITGILIREHEQTGRISFTGFYKRRIKRILPASTLVLLVTVIAASIVFNVARAQQTVEDGLWGLLFSANWRFALVGTDYFQAEGPVSPLQHFWSLAVEEQFYFVWPWLMLLVFVISGRAFGWNARSSRMLVGLTMTLIVILSFIWALSQTQSSPTVAYFSTFTRAWELGVGALVAVSANQLSRLPHWSRPFLAWIGIAGITASLFLVTADSAFPAPWAALPVIATALVIIAGSGGEQRYIWPLTNRVSGYIGNISYSLYLWHFPIIILVAVLVPEGPLYFLIVVGSVAVLSALSYHFVEDKVRKSSWLDGKDRVAVRRRRRNGKQRRVRWANAANLRAGAILVVAPVVVFLVVLALMPRSSPEPYSRPADLGSVAEESDPVAVDTTQSALTEQIDASLNSGEWPSFTPSLADLGRSALAPEWVEDGCLGMEQGSLSDPRENALRCVYGDVEAPNQAVLLADSVGISWMPALRQALGADWAIHVYAMMQCPTPIVPILKNDGSPFPECAEFREWSYTQVDAVRPDLLLIGNADPLGKVAAATGLEIQQTYPLWDEATNAALDRLTPSATRTVILGSPPYGEKLSLAECVTGFNGPSDCTGTLSRRYKELARIDSEAAAARAESGVIYVDTRRWFCSTQGVCPAFVGTMPIRGDGSHLSAVFSAALTPSVTEALFPPVLTDEG